jgi:hypothetical protein
MHPNVLPSMTVLGAVIVDGPLYFVNAVPAGTPAVVLLG